MIFSLQAINYLQNILRLSNSIFNFLDDLWLNRDNSLSMDCWKIYLSVNALSVYLVVIHVSICIKATTDNFHFSRQSMYLILNASVTIIIKKLL